MSESEDYLCRDCGSDLTTDNFISAVCGACGGFNSITRRDYREYADAVDADVGGPDSDGVRLVVSSGIEGVALTDGEVWVHCKEPVDVRSNL